MSTPVHAVATPLNTCRASRARRDERVAPCCPTSATQHITTFPFAKMHGLHSVSCRFREVEFGLYAADYKCARSRGCEKNEPTHRRQRHRLIITVIAALSAICGPRM